MSANEHYVPAHVGGIIRGVQMQLVNETKSDIQCKARNGVYYVYQGQKYNLLSLDGVTVPAFDVKIVSVELREFVVPSTDIKLMVDTAGLEGITATATVLWGVE